jgi:hypothetical protein
MFSAGSGSWAAAMRTIERHGKDDVELLFADAQIEDPDAYRFLDDAEKQLGVPLHRIADGRDIWEVFVDERFIGNSRVDPCSKILKRKLMDEWIKEKGKTCDVVMVFGLDWSERTRVEKHRARMAERGFACEYPMDDRPYVTKDEILDWMRSEGVEPPRLYGLGFGHNNCGGFCVKMGLGQARHLLFTLPDVYLRHEAAEAEAMARIGPTARPFLRSRKNGITKGITMRKFREMLEEQPFLFEDFAIGGCGGGCAIDE